MSKRYSDFDTFDKSINSIYSNLPKLPTKTLFKISDKNQIEDRRVLLNKYLKELINRKDLRTCQSFRKFIEIESNFDASKVSEP